jgi:hypothetical protein
MHITGAKLLPTIEHETLIQSCMPQIQKAYQSAVEAKARSPIVLLLDLQDASGRMLADNFLGQQAVAEYLADAKGGIPAGNTPTMTVWREYSALHQMLVGAGLQTLKNPPGPKQLVIVVPSIGEWTSQIVRV